MNAPRGAVCLCSATHHPAPLDLEWHHIWPKGMGGPDTKLNHLGENAVWVCSTTHTNVHEVLRVLVARKGALSWTEAVGLYEVPVNRYTYLLALDGYRRWKAGTAGTPPVTGRT